LRPRKEPAGYEIHGGEMRDQKSVLMLGHSSVSYAETGPGDSVNDRMAAELRRLHPELDWQCHAGLLYMAPEMTAYVGRRLEREGNPDVVVLMLGEMHFTRDYVVYRVRERWPRLYRASVAIAQTLTSWGGGGPAGSPSPRGWLFRVPRRLATKFIGTAPDVRVEQAIELTKRTIDTILRREGTQVVFFFSNQVFPPNIDGAEAGRRRQLYIREVSAYCRQRSVLTVNPPDVFQREGISLELGADGWHEDAAGRQAVAALYARAVAQAVSGRPALDAPPA
jgi:hypothetical protein